MKLALILSIGLISSFSMACDMHGNSGIVEENNLFIGVNEKSPNSITEEEFNRVIDRAVEIYAPIIEEKGATLSVSRNWTSGTVNAYASRSGSTWNVAMFGGLARHETITSDGFALVVCHELGHHLGGAPRKGSRWAANEGQSDYWGTTKCFKKYAEKDNNTELMAKAVIDEHAKEVCDTQYAQEEERAVCYRGAMAGLSLGNLFRALRRSPTPLEFTTPDPNVVETTNDRHPASQCRLDTYFAGAVCNISAYEDTDYNDPNIGTCNRASARETGLRPLCWFKPPQSEEQEEEQELMSILALK